MFKEEELIEILKILGGINNIEEYQKIYNHVWRKHNQELRLKKIDEVRNYFIEEMNQNELMSKNHKKVCRILNYLKNYTNQLLENLIKEKYTHLLWTIYGAQFCWDATDK